MRKCNLPSTSNLYRLFFSNFWETKIHTGNVVSRGVVTCLPRTRSLCRHLTSSPRESQHDWSQHAVIIHSDWPISPITQLDFKTSASLRKCPNNTFKFSKCPHIRSALVYEQPRMFTEQELYMESDYFPLDIN